MEKLVRLYKELYQRFVRCTCTGWERFDYEMCTVCRYRIDLL